jgi:hypothetical protein
MGLKQWRKARLQRDESAVLKAISMLRPSQASGWPIGRLAGIHSGRTYVALARLEQSGRVTSQWADGPAPRRRLYRVAAGVGVER